MTWSVFRKATSAALYSVRGLAVALLTTVALLSTISPATATLVTGESAIDILGQFTSPSSDVTPDYVKGCPNNGASSIGFNAPSGAVIDATNHLFFVAEKGNNRVLVFTLTSGNVISSKTPANVLGQVDFVSCGVATTQSGLSGPTGLAVDPAGQRLFVADSTNNRVLVFSTASISNGMNASNELGQLDFTHALVAHDQHAITGPTGLAYDGTNNLLYVADTTNNRVMIFGTSSITNDELAANELGQPSGTAFSSNSAATTQSGMSAPKGVALDSANSLFYVADFGNNRVTTYSTSSLTNGENALNEVGQPSGVNAFTTNSAATSQSGLNGPWDLAYDSANTRLFVADPGNSRVMVFGTASLTNGENASNVLGQGTFSASGAATTQARLGGTSYLAHDSTNNQLYVSDQNNSRVLLFSTSSITNGENASDLLGEYTSPSSTATVVWTQNGGNNGPTALGFNTPYQIALDAVNNRLFVADANNNRVLVYTLNTDNSLPTGSGGHTASYVLGQSSLDGPNTTATTQSGMSQPRGLAFDAVNNRLFVGDSTNNRVLVFNTSTLTNGMNASYELCQLSGGSAFTSKTSNTTQAGCNIPAYVTFDATNDRLFVSDISNSRVTVFSVAPGTIANGENASYVLGQVDFTHGTANEGTTTNQAGISGGAEPAYDPVNSRLFVPEQGNNRVTVFNVAPGVIANGENASYELGQPSGANAFTTSNQSNGQAGMVSPRGVSYDANNGRLFVADTTNNRVTVFNVSPNVITNGENALYVLGQAAFGTNTAATTQSGMSGPSGVYYDPGSSRVFVADASNGRVLIFEGSYIGSSSPNLWTPGYD